MKRKSYLAVAGLAIAVSLFSLPPSATTAYASTAESPPMVRWVNTQKIVLAINYSNGIACSSIITGFTDTKSIDVTYTLYKQNSSGGYDYQTSWPASASGRSLYFDKTYSGTKGKYKLAVSGYVTNNAGTKEYITDNTFATL